MRITNKVMQNNALVNINNNKVAQDMLNTQLATGKKVNRPSEDPIVAIRALRLRSDVDQVTQYLKKNAPDAESWLKLTEGALKTTVSVMKDMIEQCEKGTSDQLKTEDRQVIIDSLNELYKEVYDTGEGDYAGRYIFTGYRTDTSLSFGVPTTQQYKITQLFDRKDLEQMTYVDIAADATDFKLTDLSEVQYADGASALITENDIATVEYYRFRLAYGDLDEGNSAIVKVGDETYSPKLMTNAAEAYDYISKNAGEMVLIPSTGELLLGEKLYQKMQDDPNNFSVTYTKSEWKSTDLRPQHYFYATTGGIPASYTATKDNIFNPTEFNALCMAANNAAPSSSNTPSKIEVTNGTKTLSFQLGGVSDDPNVVVVQGVGDLINKMNDFLRGTATVSLVDEGDGKGNGHLKFEASDTGTTKDLENIKITAVPKNLGDESPLLSLIGLPAEGIDTGAMATDATKEDTSDMIVYNPDYLTTRTIGQAIEYQVGFNQYLQVNTYAEDVYKHGIGRDVEEITDLANKLTDIENMRAKLEEMSKDSQYSDKEKEIIALDLEAAKKAETFTKDQLHKRFSNYITKMQGYLDDVDEALTVVGNRSARLALINNRLTDQKETFDNLKSDNEDADETEVAVNLSSAEVSYEAALMATSSMIQTTLLNYL